MTDFPIANANPDAMFLFGIFESFGIRNGFDGIEVDTVLWNQEIFPFEIISPVFSVSANEQVIYFQYNANNDGYLNVTVLLGDNSENIGSTMNFLKIDEKKIVFPIHFKKTNQVQWQLKWK